MTSTEIRELSGMSRAAFARKYGIPIRTIEDWDSGRSHPPWWVMRLLERVVRADIEEGT